MRVASGRGHGASYVDRTVSPYWTNEAELGSRDADGRRRGCGADDDGSGGARAARDRRRAVGIRPAEARPESIAHLWSPAAAASMRCCPGSSRAGSPSAPPVTQSAARQAAVPHRPTGTRVARRVARGVEPGARETFFLKLFVGEADDNERPGRAPRAVPTRHRGDPRTPARDPADELERGTTGSAGTCSGSGSSERSTSSNGRRGSSERSSGAR